MKTEMICCDKNGSLLYQFGLHPHDLPGKYFFIPHPETGLPTLMTICKLIDDYDDEHQRDKTRQDHFEVHFTTDEKDNIMSYMTLLII